MDDRDITYFAETDFRGKRTKFGIKSEDRARHVYVIGKTGMGKSTTLENMAIQDIQRGEGMAFIDPHGGTAEKLLDYVPADRIKDVVYFAPFDLEHPISFNVMEDVGKDQRHLVVNGLMSAFKKIWVDAWSARMEYILQNTILILLEYPGATLLGVNRVLSDKEYRKKVVENATDPSARSFWLDEFANYTERMAAESVPAIQNKIGQFTANPLIRNIIGQPKSSFDFRKVMDERKILIVNLSKGRMGESNANLLGSMIITKIYLAAMSRANIPAPVLRTLPSFYFYVDEFQSFANESFANILSEARKYKLSLTIAHQYIEQMSEEVRAAVFGNVGSIISYRVGPFDAEIFEKIFGPTFMKEDMVNLGLYQMYLTLMINGVGSQPFSARGMPPIPQDGVSNRDDIIATSRARYSRPQVEVEAEINKWHEESDLKSSRLSGGASRFPGGASRQSGRRPQSRVPQSRSVSSTSSPGRPVPAATPATAPASQPLGKAITQALDEKKPPGKPRQKAGSLPLSSLKDQPNKDKSTGRHAADLKQVLQSVQAELKSALPPKGNIAANKPSSSTRSPDQPIQSLSKPARPDDTGRSGEQDEVSETDLRQVLKI
ncbi:MAG: type IV secretion system DNA-binding domain-containing protein [Patescibacteria group bacterium]|nr:type IV secretion system DNA-binding domain-containing protein [Patescibacteria group bacterium]